MKQKEILLRLSQRQINIYCIYIYPDLPEQYVITNHCIHRINYKCLSCLLTLNKLSKIKLNSFLRMGLLNLSSCAHSPYKTVLLHHPFQKTISQSWCALPYLYLTGDGRWVSEHQTQQDLLN